MDLAAAPENRGHEPSHPGKATAPLVPRSLVDSPCQTLRLPGLYLRSAAVTSTNDTRVAVVAVRALDPGPDGARGLWGTAPALSPLSSAPTAPARPGPAGGALLPPASATAHPRGRGREGGAAKALRSSEPGLAAPGSAQNPRQVTALGTGAEGQAAPGRARGEWGRDGGRRWRVQGVCAPRGECMGLLGDAHMSGKPRSLVLKVAAQR